RVDTEAYCREHGLAYVDDPHNADLARTRARLRKLWPLLVELNPRLEEALAGTADLLAEENELLESLPPGSHPALQRRAILKRANIAGVHPERDHLKQLLQLLARGRGSIDLPGGWAEIRDGDVVFSVGPRSRAR